MLRSVVKALVRRLRGEARRRGAGFLEAAAGRRGDALVAEGRAALLAGDPDRARALALAALECEPQHPQAHLLLARVHAARAEAAAALQRIERALALDPESADAYFLRGRILAERSRAREAVAEYARALVADPAHREALDHKGAAHDELGEFEEALGCAERLIEICPGDARAHHKKALMLRELGRLAEAEAALREALALEPELREAACHLALVWIEQGRFAEAEQQLARVLARAPEDVEARWTMALLNLLQGRFAVGWEYYRAREARRGASERRPDLPQWDGRPLPEGTLLIYSEQGLGDEIMFASCFPDALRRVRWCAIECEPRLVPLFRRSFPGAFVSARAAGQPAIPRPAAQIAAGDLPGLFRRDWCDFPRHDGYLVAAPERVAAWRERLRALGPGPKIGLAWTGGTVKTKRRLRSLPLAELRPVLALGGAHFMSLQYVDSAREIAEFSARHGIRVLHWLEAGCDYDETAALVAALDMVLSVCTAVVHLSGALGKRTWVMVPAMPEWRYLAQGEAMPWYPAVRLFRQQQPGDWRPVIERVAAELRGALASGTLHAGPTC